MESPLEALVREVGDDEASRIMQDKYGPHWLYQFRGCWAREHQLCPEGDWKIWLFLGGRGAGKSRAGAEWVKERVAAGAKRIALVGRSAGDVRDVIVEGESGILSIYPDKERPLYEPSKRRLTWPNGATATTFSAEEPDSFRGFQEDTVWADELAAWDSEDSWDQLMFGLRLGTNPRAVVTTTPKAKPIIRNLIKDPRCRVVRATSYDNASNISLDMIGKYKGTRLGRQEILAEVLEDSENALWTSEQLEKIKVETLPEMRRVVVGVDPSQGSKKTNDDQGIVVCGLGEDGLFYVIKDCTLKSTPEAWGGVAVAASMQFGASCIVVETNAGGAMAKMVIEVAAKSRGCSIRIKPVLAKSGKGTRAEPIAALYELGKVRHARGLEKLEDEMCHLTPNGYEGSGSPNRIDGCVWALLELANVRQVSGIVDETIQEWAK